MRRRDEPVRQAYGTCTAIRAGYYQPKAGNLGPQSVPFKADAGASLYSKCTTQ